MSLDILISALKIAGSAIAGVLGIMGIVFNFRDTGGRVNRWGFLIITGIFLSTLLAIVGSIAESQKENVIANEQAVRTEKVLTEINRSIQPITELEISYWVKLPQNEPVVNRFSKIISIIVNNNVEKLLNIPRDKDLEGIDAWAIGQNDEILNVTMKPNTKFWPMGENSVIGDLARNLTFNIFIRKIPENPESFETIISVSNDKSDWIATSLPFDLDNVLDLEMKTMNLSVHGSYNYDKSMWKSNGKITSIIDLLGSKLLIIPNGASTIDLPKRFGRFSNEKTKKLTELLEIKTILLRFSEGREYWISGDKFEKTPFKFGFPAFSIIFPNTLEEMENLGNS